MILFSSETLPCRGWSVASTLPKRCCRGRPTGRSTRRVVHPAAGTVVLSAAASSCHVFSRYSNSRFILGTWPPLANPLRYSLRHSQAAARPSGVQPSVSWLPGSTSREDFSSPCGTNAAAFAEGRRQFVDYEGIVHEGIYAGCAGIDPVTRESFEVLPASGANADPGLIRLVLCQCMSKKRYQPPRLV